VRRSMTILAAVFVNSAVLAGTAGATKPRAASPNLCAHECGGSWGAYEHAKKTAENEGGTSVTVESCSNQGTNQRGVTQWACVGVGWWLVVGGGRREDRFHIGLDPYGYTTYFYLEVA
jgi:hypothetical protein